MNRRWLAAAALWTLFGLITGLQLWISMITHGHYVPLLIGYNVLIWEGWLALSVAVVSLTRRVPLIPFHARNLLMHILAAIIAAVVHITFWLVLTRVLRPFDPVPVSWAHADVLATIFS